MGGQHKLAAVKPGRICQKIRQSDLPRGGKAVFRFIQQIKGIPAQFFLEHQKGAFAVGVGADVGRQSFARHLRFGIAPCRADLLEPVIILHAVHLEFGGAGLGVFIKQAAAAGINVIVDGAHIQHIVKHIVAGQNQAARRDGVQGVELAQGNIIREEITAVILCPALQAQSVRHHVERCGFAGAVAAVQNGHIRQVQCFQAPARKQAKGVERIIAGHFGPRRLGKVVSLAVLAGKIKFRKIDHISLLPSGFFLKLYHTAG